MCQTFLKVPLFWESPVFGTFHGVRRWLTRGLTCKSVYASKSQPTRPTHHPPLITESRDCPAPSIVLNLCCNHILPPSFLSHHHQLELQLCNPVYCSSPLPELGPRGLEGGGEDNERHVGVRGGQTHPAGLPRHPHQAQDPPRPGLVCSRPGGGPHDRLRLRLAARRLPEGLQAQGDLSFPSEPLLADFCNPRTLAMTHNGQGLHAEMDPNDQLEQFSYFITHTGHFFSTSLLGNFYVFLFPFFLR